MKNITYIPPNNNVVPYQRSNCSEVMEFVGPILPCPICNDSGEYENKAGFVQGCNPCNSRLIPFINFEGKRDHMDWGDTVERHKDGLHLIRGTNDD